MSFISGLLPLDKTALPLTDKPIEFQINQVLEKFKPCLIGIKSTKTDITQVKMYITDINEWPVVNELYAKWIGEHKPARLVAGVKSFILAVRVKLKPMVIKEQTL